MKTLFKLIILISFSIQAQTEINLSGITSDGSIGQNCSNSQPQEDFITTGDVNLNGYILKLKNVNLEITGNLNGPGVLDACGNSSFCIGGIMQNGAGYNGERLNCDTLSIKEYNIEDNLPLEKSYAIYDLQGRLISEGFTDKNTFSLFPKEITLYLFIEGYKTKTIYIY